jgi:predicted HTH transcriptional regulator
MSLYTKSVNQLTTADLQSLLSESAVENVLLEFKSQDVLKDEALKKLSSFANTYGGHLIIGALGDANGKLLSFPGVKPISNLKQRIEPISYMGVSP